MTQRIEAIQTALDHADEIIGEDHPATETIRQAFHMEEKTDGSIAHDSQVGATLWTAQRFLDSESVDGLYPTAWYPLIDSLALAMRC